MAEGVYKFDRFTLDAERRILTDSGGAVIDLTPKAVDILCILVKNAGQLVTKEELMKRVWADSFVEDASLSHHIFKLRKALGESEERKVIETVPKRGYRFIGELREQVQSVGPGSGPRPRSPWRMIAIGAAIVLLFLATGWFLNSRRTSVSQEPAVAAGIRSVAHDMLHVKLHERTRHFFPTLSANFNSVLRYILTLLLKDRLNVKRGAPRNATSRCSSGVGADFRSLFPSMTNELPLGATPTNRSSPAY